MALAFSIEYQFMECVIYHFVFVQGNLVHAQIFVIRNSIRVKINIIVT